jgi:radical SAM/Cys-rich protein
MREAEFPSLKRARLETIQVNLGYVCNQSCVHCHVDAGPWRTESMDRRTATQVLRLLRESSAERLDLTGGAPELNPEFRYLVREARSLGAQVIDRSNLTVLEETGQEDLARFLARQRVTIIASLPCYLEDNVDAQRGRGTFRRSLSALRKLNGLGYGKTGTGLELVLVFNPQGPTLPPPQTELEAAYKEHLEREFGVVFNRLLTITNMPIRRFRRLLTARGELELYERLLQSAHRDGNLEAVMCRSLLSIDWRGCVYDCDFNQMLDLRPSWNGRGPLHISEIAGVELKGLPISVSSHCFGCTAGQGSSCSGALS